jgi:molecular chaperone GrpE
MNDNPARPEQDAAAPEDTVESVFLRDAAGSLDVEPIVRELGLDLPADDAEARDLLLRELMESNQESARLLDDLQRIAADYSNYRKRTERDQIETVQRASQRVVEALLPVLDSMDAASGYDAQTDGERRMLEGLRSTHGLLLDALAKEGLEPVPSDPGTPFDPAIHEAVSGTTDGNGDIVVAQEVRRGYSMRGRVIRPALVMVHTDADDA